MLLGSCRAVVSFSFDADRGSGAGGYGDRATIDLAIEFKLLFVGGQLLVFCLLEQ